MIYDELVTYEVAALAKEKGFPQNTSRFLRDAPCRNYYTRKGELNGDCLEIIQYMIANKTKDIPADIQTVAAPTQALLQRWLREERGIIVEVFVDDDSNMPLTYNIHQYKDWNWECVCHYHDNYYAIFDWEQALEDGLKYALENLV